ncbi:MAG: NAD(P)-dependent oxidoreductase [Sedimenticola sp.]
MRVLVTGGAGFIGSHVVKTLLEKGFDVTVLVRESTDTWRIDRLHGKFDIVSSDLCDKGLHETVAGVQADVVVHCAAVYRRDNDSEDREVLVSGNTIGTVALYEACSQSGVSLFINLCTGFVFSGYDRPVTETDLPVPVSFYATSKLAAMHGMLPLYRKYRATRLVTLRIFSPYGPFDNRDKLIPYMLGRLGRGEGIDTTPGEQLRDYLHVDDIVAAILRVMDRQDMFKGDPSLYHLGLGEMHRLREFILEAASAMGRDESAVNFGARSYLEQDRALMVYAAEIDKARRELDWVPGIAPAEGIRMVIDAERTAGLLE